VWTTIGSSNFDERSFRLNDEVNVNVYDDILGAQMETMFHADLARCEEVTLHKWFRRGWWDKLKEKAADVFKPQL
ncbi:MAG: phospholipase D-like domain-containing protein, partial [Thermoanaerobaculia bacterium]